jgi:hypothetical protein
MFSMSKPVEVAGRAFEARPDWSTMGGFQAVHGVAPERVG